MSEQSAPHARWDWEKAPAAVRPANPRTSTRAVSRKRREAVLAAAYVLAVALGIATFAGTDHTAFVLFFSWPNGGVWSNLAASFVLGVPAVYLTLRKIARNHAEHMRVLHQHHASLLRHLGARDE